ncbi:hypothetical protein DAEQUDRAFT_34960 [Daedalea quercina L-15889]|uniref:Uncharacterized protein n=1 Tax=Daedalea quercina L-15889 TaxID=1314783 RepID=A0A165SSC7_9APHY|nr:hypothetical protein DAEQUDRAFT_34960 [Daedalea quercina L-15889]
MMASRSRRSHAFYGPSKRHPPSGTTDGRVVLLVWHATLPDPRSGTKLPVPRPLTTPDAGTIVAGGECDLMTTKTRGKSGKSRPRCGAGAEERPRLARLLSERKRRRLRGGCGMPPDGLERPICRLSDAFRTSEGCSLPDAPCVCLWGITTRGSG